MTGSTTILRTRERLILKRSIKKCRQKLPELTAINPNLLKYTAVPSLEFEIAHYKQNTAYPNGYTVFYAQGEARNAPQKHGRLARLERFAILPVSSPRRLASSSAGRASALRPAPSRRSGSRLHTINKTPHTRMGIRCFTRKERLELSRRGLADLRP